MIKRGLSLMIIGAAIVFSGCANTPAGNANEAEPKAEEQVTAESTEDVAEGSAEKEEVPVEESTEADTELSEDMVSDSDTESEENGDAIIEDSSATEEAGAVGGPEEGKYDRTYLEEENGTYVYRMSDTALIQKYDELYEGAFDKIVESYNEVMKWQNQSFNANGKYTAGSLVLKDKDDTAVMNTGSYYEMDYNFNLENVGYTYVDLNSDGNFEIIFGVVSDADAEWIPEDYFERAYALIDGKLLQICDGGSRDLHWLGSDGYIYETGSGGAANWGTDRLHYDPSNIEIHEEYGWGSNAFISDEFLGYWEEPVHIKDSYTDIDEASRISESQITEDEFERLNNEWDARKIKIDWLRFSDYMQKESLG
ncbi:hypothetical protein [Butyrivibrio sp. JL13D10]|uniref:hypothetical protein n=1 Tax=Butyrivibrio sp. JL13D10 TaxID=3236815 RepID=UPI0038B6A418